MFRPPAHAVTLELSSTLDVPPFPPDGWGGELLDRSLRDAALDEIARTQARAAALIAATVTGAILVPLTT